VISDEATPDLPELPDLPTASSSAPAPISLTAIVPCYNEAAALEVAYQQIKAALACYGEVELLFVDDGSTDGTLERIKQLAAADPSVRYLALARNYGLAASSSAGFKYASKEWSVQFDADLQSPATEAHKLIAKALEGYDAVFSVRLGRGREDPWLRRAGSAAASWMARSLLGIELPAGAWSFRVVRTSVAKKVVALDLPLRYFIATLPRISARYTSLPTVHRRRERGHGRSRFGLRRLIVLALELFFGFSYRPLVLLPLVAAAAAALLALATALAAAGRLGDRLLGVLILATGVLTLSGLAVLGGYVLRIAESQGRPARFYVREANLPIVPSDDLYEHERRAVAAAP
jgi:glycosyltransferase involved in cell wall biosynthesis